MLEENHVHTNLTLTEEGVLMTDREGKQITTRIFTATKTIDLTFPEEALQLEKRQHQRMLAWIDDLLSRMAAL